MILRLVGLMWCLVLATGWAGRADAASFPLNNGETLEGEPISFTAQGLVVRKPDSSFSTRMPWTNFTQTALKQLSSNPKIKLLVESYLEVDEPESSPKKKAVTADPKIPDRLDRPNPKSGFSELFKHGLTVTLFLLIYAANIYGGYEVGLFRNYPPVMVCGVAAVLPILGLIIFLCIPTRLQKSQDELAAEAMAQHAPVAHGHADAHGHHAHDAAAAEAAPEADNPAEPAAPQAVVYLRGQTTFNRRFFETKFAGFLRMVPGDAEKDKVIFIKSSRGEHVGTRLARIQPAELYLQITKAGASSEVMIPFTEIMEVQVRQRGPHDT